MIQNNLKILIIDDQMESVALLLNYLKGQPLEMQIALTGEDGLIKAIMGRPDAILVDIAMPTMDGYEVCRRLKADPRTSGAAVIFLSANDTTAHKLQGFALGGVDFIGKPFSSEEVLARIYVHLNLADEIERLKSNMLAGEVTGQNKPLHRDEKIMSLAIAYLQANIVDWPGLDKLAQQAHTNEKKLTELFKSQLGMTAYDYLLDLRLEKARLLLAETHLQIQLISERIGYQNPSDFSRSFRRRYGMGPRQYRQVILQTNGENIA
jgi:YesN/AraC family two-component response regulator